MPRSVECYAAGAGKGRPCKNPGAGITDQNRTGSFEPQPLPTRSEKKAQKTGIPLRAQRTFSYIFRKMLIFGNLVLLTH